MMNQQSRSEWSIGIIVLLLLSAGASLFARVPPDVKCADAKAKAAAFAVYAQAQCRAKAALAGTGVDAKCLLKAESKLRGSYAKADGKGTCPGNADAALSAASACATTFSEAISGDARCAAVKLKAAGVKARDKAACARKAAKGPEAVAECVEKVETKFSATVTKADEKGSCTGTASELEALVDACAATLPPPHCTSAGSPTCNGACPDGLTCRPYEVFANGASIETGCSCVDVVNGPECGSPVCSMDQHCPDPDFVCEQWTEGDPLACDHTICQPAMVTPPPLPPPGSENMTPCDGGEFPTCGGTCPDGLRCQSFEAFFQGSALFAGCLCVDPRAPRCEAAAECSIDVIPFTHCADPSLTCLVTLEAGGDDKPLCTEAHCGVAVPTTSRASIPRTSGRGRSTAWATTGRSTTGRWSAGTTSTRA
jgi:hypothetical protein